MIVYTNTKDSIEKNVLRLEDNIPKNTVWLDLVEISIEEEKKLEEYFGIDIPTPAETDNIAVSNRLYEEKGAVYMAVNLYINSKLNIFNFEICTITFVLLEGILITVRSKNSDFLGDINLTHQKYRLSKNKSLSLMLTLLEKIINSTSAFLEEIGHTLNAQNKSIMQLNTSTKTKQINHKILLKNVAALGISVSKTQESLVTFHRMLTFLSQQDVITRSKAFSRCMNAYLKDIESLSNHVSFLTTRINFLLDTTLGLINIEQNSIIRIFSVVSVVFTPPTLIASSYGMNFEVMPELKWLLGYPFAIMIMLISGWVPYRYFKRKGWC